MYTQTHDHAAIVNMAMMGPERRREQLRAYGNSRLAALHRTYFPDGTVPINRRWAIEQIVTHEWRGMVK